MFCSSMCEVCYLTLLKIYLSLYIMEFLIMFDWLMSICKSAMTKQGSPTVSLCENIACIDCLLISFVWKDKFKDVHIYLWTSLFCMDTYCVGTFRDLFEMLVIDVLQNTVTAFKDIQNAELKAIKEKNLEICMSRHVNMICQTSYCKGIQQRSWSVLH